MPTLPRNIMLLGAYNLAKAGWMVFPCAPDRKTPLFPSAHPEGDPARGRCTGECGAIGHGVHDATLDPELIQKWWTDTPMANIGVATGATSRITVIDIDGPKGAAFVKSLNLPKTWTVRTPRGGYHLYFKYNPAFHTGAGFVEQVDCRNDGGYVLAEPSMVNGKPYEVVRDVELAEMAVVPDVFLKHDRRQAQQRTSHQEDRHRTPDWVLDAMGGVGESQRNDTTARLAGYYHRIGFSEELILTILEPFAAKCSPPMALHELQKTVQSVSRYPIQGSTLFASLGNEQTLYLR